ncbi:MAG: DUF6443 domain-containing protein, partial [Dysgonamonadaceae bacterium]|nr:DUF6443 domain-containing protein [Dysgonamonadaceae bacterium]
MKAKIFFIFTAILLNFSIKAQNTYNKQTPVSADTASMTGYNYIKTRTNTSTNNDYFIEKVQYFDGLGRPTQTVQVGITPAQADLVTQQNYDEFGRESLLWLPAVAAGNYGGYANISAKAAATYGNTALNIASDPEPYSYPKYEASPLNRVTEQYGAGTDWFFSGHSVKTFYLTNTASGEQSCAYFYVSGNGDNLSRSGNYMAGSLFVTQNYDEDCNISYEFKDKLGRVVLQRQQNDSQNFDTYYVYDDMGNLRYVLPPLASDALTGTSYTPENAIIKNYAYFYKYNSRNLVKYKRLPGCEPVYYVYDRADRLIYTQDGEQRVAEKWLFTVPDALGRAVLTGICTNTGLNIDNVLTEAITAGRSANGTLKGYSFAANSAVYPENPVILSVNYYDDYSFRGASGIGIPAGNFELCTDADFNTEYSNAKGLLTGTLSAVLDGNATPAKYLYSIMYYDYRGQVIQTVSNNLANGQEREYFAYTFTGQVAKKRHLHSADFEEEEAEEIGEPVEETEPWQGTEENYRYDYDHADRLINTVYRLNYDDEILLSANTYDELGRLKTVTPHERTDFSSTYSYDIRSRVREITGTNFSESLEYTFGSNISKMLCTQGEVQRGYSSLAYDRLNRLKTATYSGTENYSATYDYDKNGNITNINRGAYDILLFNYNNTNQMYNVSDAWSNSSSASVSEFKDYSVSSGQEYWYNTNGAMTKDLNRGISEITYNLLNLSLKVDIKHPHAEARNEYTYSAGGKKLKVVSHRASSYSSSPVIGSAVNTESLNVTKTTDYIGNFVYENGVLKRILTENGYYENNNYYFYVRNHLGSNAIVADMNGNIVQQNHFYPFGQTMAISTGHGAQPYKFTGKELDLENG